MAKNSPIEWTHHTFNPWWGCAKVSPACEHCYAEAWATRLGLQLWGLRAPRRFFGDEHWNHPRRWDREAARVGERRRVFCASMADVFEARPDLDEPRARLWALIRETPNLDWLLLTKRPECVASAVPWTAWPPNVWLGTTAETQQWAEQRLDLLLGNPAVVHFVSCEPLLGPIDLMKWLPPRGSLRWVIAGGESGRRARLMAPEWVRDLRDQCSTSGVAFHFKQWGVWSPTPDAAPKRLSKKAAGRVLDGRTWDGVPSVHV